GLIEKVTGRDVYSRYDKAVKELSDEKRTINMHHSLGTKLKEKGAKVISIDIAGSRYKQFRRDHSGAGGDTSLGKDLSKEEREFYETIYGKQIGKKRKYLRAKGDLKEDGKTRFLVGGVQYLRGILNRGNYSIENNVDYAYGMMTDKLKLIINEWKGKDPKSLEPVYINLQAHSRGAVAASKAVLRMNNWLEDMLKKEHLESCRSLIKVNMIQLDPVPGLGSNDGLNHKLDLQKNSVVTENKSGKKHYKGFSDPSMINATTCYSMYSEYSSVMFPSQQVRGQSRIILKAVGHNMGMDKVDASQLLVKGDGKIHRRMVIDGATMEGYRGSGYSELPKGVFVEDENGVLIRMRDMKEAVEIMEGLKKDIGDQKGRQDSIKEVIKNWFVDNEYVDDTLADYDIRDMIYSEKNLADIRDLKKNYKDPDGEPSLYTDLIASIVDSYEKGRNLYTGMQSEENMETDIKSELIWQSENVIRNCKAVMTSEKFRDNRDVILTCSRALSIYRAVLSGVKTGNETDNEDTLENERTYTSFRDIMTAVKYDQKRGGKKDSPQMKQIKDTIVSIEKDLEGGIIKDDIIDSPEIFEKMKYSLMEKYMELLRSCKEYQTKRGEDKDDPTSRHGKVSTLIYSVRAEIFRISSLNSNTVTGLFSDGQGLLRLDGLFKQDRRELTMNWEKDAEKAIEVVCKEKNINSEEFIKENMADLDKSEFLKKLKESKKWYYGEFPNDEYDDEYKELFYKRMLENSQEDNDTE
nr:hypothetical protein [Lachnospiraceae bacterium]